MESSIGFVNCCQRFRIGRADHVALSPVRRDARPATGMARPRPGLPNREPGVHRNPAGQAQVRTATTDQDTCGSRVRPPGRRRPRAHQHVATKEGKRQTGFRSRIQGTVHPDEVMQPLPRASRTAPPASALSSFGRHCRVPKIWLPRSGNDQCSVPGPPAARRPA